MPVIEARIETDRASRYLVQFCKHADAMGSRRGHRFRPHGGSAAARAEVRVHAEWSNTHGNVVFDPWGRAALDADATGLTVRVETTNHDDLQRIQQIIGNDLDRFSRNQLTPDWQPVETATEPGEGPLG